MKKTIILEDSFVNSLVEKFRNVDAFCCRLTCFLVEIDSKRHIYSFEKSPHENELVCNVYLTNEPDFHISLMSHFEDRYIIALYKKGILQLFYNEVVNNKLTTYPVIMGAKCKTLSKVDCEVFRKLVNPDNKIFIFESIKEYSSETQAAFQQRSIVQLNDLKSLNIAIVWFNGCQALLEKLLYAGCGYLTVFLDDNCKALYVKKEISKLCKHSPFSNRIELFVGNNCSYKHYDFVVGNNNSINTSVCKNFLVFGLDKDGTIIISQNNPINGKDSVSIKPYRIQLFTSIMTELILNDISVGCFDTSYLYKLKKDDALIKLHMEER